MVLHIEDPAVPILPALIRGIGKILALTSL
jgi:hypothetical protein